MKCYRNNYQATTRDPQNILLDLPIILSGNSFLHYLLFPKLFAKIYWNYSWEELNTSYDSFIGVGDCWLQYLDISFHFYAGSMREFYYSGIIPDSFSHLLFPKLFRYILLISRPATTDTTLPNSNESCECTNFMKHEDTVCILL